MMVEQWAACAKRGWLRTARARWSVTVGERSSLGTHLISHFGLAARIPLRPLNGQETAGGGGQNGRSGPDPRLLSPLRDGWRPPCCCRAFLRAQLGAAAALDARRPRRQPVDRSASGKLHAAGPSAPAELRWGSGGRAGCGGRAGRPGRGADREGDAEPPRSVVRRVPPPAHPPPVGAAVPRSRGSRRSRQLGASSGDAAAQRRRRRCCCRAWAPRARWSASAVPALDPAGAVPSPLALSARAPLISPPPTPFQIWIHPIPDLDPREV